MNKILKYDRKTFIIKPYLSSTERDLLLVTADEYNSDTLDKVFSILKNNIISDNLEGLTRSEKMYLILELRNISVGEIFNLRKHCSKCGKLFDFEGVFSGVNESKFRHDDIHEVFSDDFNDYVNFDLDDLDLDEYDDYVCDIRDNKLKFNFSTSVTCLHCREKNNTILTEEILLSSLSDDTISTYYNTISTMIYYGHFSKLDIDSMYPFERGIYLNLLEKLNEKQANQSNN